MLLCSLYFAFYSVEKFIKTVEIHQNKNPPLLFGWITSLNNWTKYIYLKVMVRDLYNEVMSAANPPNESPALLEGFQSKVLPWDTTGIFRLSSNEKQFTNLHINWQN